MKKWICLLLILLLPFSACAEYRVALITDYGNINDQSFNQITYEAMSEYCEENNISYTYKKPDGDTDYARVAMVDVAVAEGYNIIILPGFSFAATIVEVTEKYPDVKFICLDITEGDIIAAAVGNGIDENTNEVKGKCKLKPYKSYFAFEIRDNN